MRRAARKDANHGEIKNAFESIGCTVADLASSGVSGFPDLVVGIGSRNIMVEVKNLKSRYGKAGLNQNQKDFAAAWTGGPIYVVTSVDDAIALVNKERGYGVGKSSQA